MDNVNDSKPVTLTRREKDVLRLIAKGYTTDQIAESLGIGPETVRGYRKQLHKKFKVNKATELTYKATELHII